MTLARCFVLFFLGLIKQRAPVGSDKRAGHAGRHPHVRRAPLLRTSQSSTTAPASTSSGANNFWSDWHLQPLSPSGFGGLAGVTLKDWGKREHDTRQVNWRLGGARKAFASACRSVPATGRHVFASPLAMRVAAECNRFSGITLAAATEPTRLDVCSPSIRLFASFQNDTVQGGDAANHGPIRIYVASNEDAAEGGRA
jgi:hypothetical protein